MNHWLNSREKNNANGWPCDQLLLFMLKHGNFIAGTHRDSRVHSKHGKAICLATLLFRLYWSAYFTLKYLFIYPPQRSYRERSGSVVECLTRDKGAAGSSLTGVTVLCPLARHINPSLVLLQPRKTRPYITENCWWDVKNQIKQIKQTKVLW